METLFSSLPVALSVIGYLMYQDWRDGKFKDQSAAPITKMSEDMKHLRVHFNDELTGVLTNIQVKIIDITDTQHEMLDNQKEGMRAISKIANNQEEIIKYGMRSRKS